MQTELFLPNTEEGSLSTQVLVKRLKSENSDFEWYPTSEEMISAVFNDIAKSSNPSEIDSVLDIGAGDGRVLLSLSEKAKNSPIFYTNGKVEHISNRFILKAIEKSQSHVARFHDDIVFVGGDLMQTQLGSKNADIIFCNPPYSDFDRWSSVIISESFCDAIYLVLPSRWHKSEAIKNALKNREKIAEVIYSGNFLNADRKARAKVDVIRVSSIISQERQARFLTEKEKNFTFLVSSKYCNDGSNSDKAFEDWFSRRYPEINKKASRDKSSSIEKSKSNSINRGLIPISPTVIELVSFYDADMERLIGNYDKLEELDVELFYELKINVESIKKTLKNRIYDLKIEYWKELFNIYAPIKEALTHKFRQNLFGELHDLIVELDFNSANALILTNILLKRASGMREAQIVDFYKDLSNPESVKMYKSNQRVFERENWRYKEDSQSKNSHYQLDYRIVQYGLMGLYQTGWDKKINKFSVVKVLDDLAIIARLVGVASSANYSVFSDIEAGDRVIIEFMPNGKKPEMLADLRFFKNGNVHLRMNKEFSLRLNVMVGKLLGWIHSPKEAELELELDTKQAKSVESFYDELGDDLKLPFNSRNLLGLPMLDME